MTPEGKIKKEVNKLLAELGDTVYKFMPIPGYGGMGAPCLDYLLCAGGRLFAVEVKKNEKALVTGRQIATMNTIRRAGGKVFVVYDDETVKELGEALHKKTRKSGTVEDISIHITNPAWRVRELLRSDQ